MSAAAGAVTALRDGGSRLVDRVRLAVGSHRGGGLAAFAGTPCSGEAGTAADDRGASDGARTVPVDAGPEGS
jgi:hypothetical protein